MRLITESSNNSRCQITLKVVPVLLTEYNAMKAHWVVEVYLHTFFDLGTRWR
jgi:hypothetical protein